jgi:hypothetical protein
MKTNTYKSYVIKQFCTYFLIVFFLNSYNNALHGQAQEQFGGDLEITNVKPISANHLLMREAAGVLVVNPAASYSNVTTFSGQGYAGGGATLTSGNTITRLIADDVTLVGTPPFGVATFSFNIANLNTVAVSARPRIRFYLADGAGGAPGTYITGFSFNATSFTAGSVNTLSANVTPFNVTSNTFWAGITFDNNTGASGATAAQLDNLGMGIFNPIDVGTSTDAIFQTTAAGSFLANAPAGATTNFGGSPVANLGWEFITTATINSISRVNPSPALSGSSVSWTVTFNKVMSGLTASNFSLVNTGLTSPSITAVTPVTAAPSTQWTITASTGSGVGTLGLNYANNTGASIPAANTLPVVGAVYTVNASLPIELIRFTAHQVQQSNLLKWETASETDNKGFQIERHQDNGSWDIIGFVKGQGKAATYDFKDNYPFSITNYRLRQVDNNGKETLSKIVTVAVKRKEVLKVYPSVSSGNLTLEAKENTVFYVYNLLGQEVLSGNTANQIDVSALAKGTYILKVDDEQVKFVKQ